jgi:hypothetical protein
VKILFLAAILLAGCDRKPATEPGVTVKVGYDFTLQRMLQRLDGLFDLSETDFSKQVALIKDEWPEIHFSTSRRPEYNEAVSNIDSAVHGCMALMHLFSASVSKNDTQIMLMREEFQTFWGTERLARLEAAAKAEGGFLYLGPQGVEFQRMTVDRIKFHVRMATKELELVKLKGVI